jgi:succinate dehydrogenase/fumarate reductase flavoprotein subunit
MAGAPQAGGLVGPVRLWSTSAAPPAAPVIPTEAAVRALMWQSVGLWRERLPLAEAASTLAGYDAALSGSAGAEAIAGGGWRLRNLVTVARLMTGAALRRTESRGSHYRADFPARDDVHWLAHITERSRT